MKRFCLILLLLLILPTFLMACTDKDAQETTNAAVPTAAAPAPSNGAASPAGTGEAVNPAETAEANNPVNDTQDTPVSTTVVPFSGMEIEDSYVETVGDDVEIGGD